MRHRKAGYKLGRTTSHRKAMMRNMVTSLIEHERIVTTEVKAKAVRPLVEKMITLAKRGDLHARRLALAVLTKKSVTHKLFSGIKDRFMDRAGGYTSIVRIGPRHGDAAPMAVLELINPEQRAKEAKKTKKAKKKAKKGETPVKASPKTAAPKAVPAPAVAEEPKPLESASAEEPPVSEAAPSPASDTPAGSESQETKTE